MPAPTKLNNRHMVMAHMAAIGRMPGEIASKLGLHPNYVGICLKSPLFKAYVEQLQKEIKENTINSVQEFIDQETLPSFEALKNIRDAGDSDAVRISAAKEIIAHSDLVTKKTEIKIDQTKRIVIERGDLIDMMKAVAEDEGGELPEEILTDGEELPLLSQASLHQPKTIQELCEELEAEEVER